MVRSKHAKWPLIVKKSKTIVLNRLNSTIRNRNGVGLSCRLSFVAESVKDFVDVLETLDEFRYLSRCKLNAIPDKPDGERPTFRCQL